MNNKITIFFSFHYLHRHGLYKNQLLPLHNQQLYIVHDNIEITNAGEMSNYSILTHGPVYKLEIEDPIINVRTSNNRKRVINHVGYVKLKCSELIKKMNDPMMSESNSYSGKMMNNNSNDDDIEDDDSGYTDVVNGTSPHPPPLPPAGNRPQFRDSLNMSTTKVSKTLNSTGIYGGAGAGRGKIPNGYINGIPLSTTSTSSSTSPPSSEYDYAFITALNTHQPLSAMRSSNTSDKPLSTVALPDSCITEIISGQTKYNTYSSDDDDDTSTSSTNEGSSSTHSNTRSRLDMPEYAICDQKQYLNSKAFLAYFINMFQETLAEDLNINKDDLINATWKGSVIYSSQWEIIPAISGPWPREADEWRYRKRGILENPKTGQKFEWPTKAMVHKVVGFGCHVIPHGFAPKNGINPQRDLEWKIVFPEAERYLESCLTAAQAKVYLITKILFKTFVEPNLNSGLNMFTTEHIRAHLFWQCENNYAAWPEDFLGEALIRFLNTLLQNIKKKSLPDYFLPKRNLFENIPEKILVELHRRIFRITESPVMHLLIALRNTTCIKDFYPRLKYKRLYSILVIANPFLLINPNIQERTQTTNDESIEEDDETAVGSIAYYNKQEKRHRRRRTKLIRTMEAEKLRKEQGRIPERRDSVESIDTKVIIRIMIYNFFELIIFILFQFVFLKHMEQIRRKLIYEIFIKQFKEMAEVSCKYNSLNQALIYLNQAERLCWLMEDDSETQEGELHLNEIKNLKTKIIRRISENSAAPALPRRESMMEPVNRLRVRLNPIASRTTKTKDDFDPYTNIDAIKSFVPEALDSDEETEVVHINQVVIADAQIHAHPAVNNSAADIRVNGSETTIKILDNDINYEENDVPPPLPMKNEQFIKKKLLMQEKQLLEMKLQENQISDIKLNGSSVEVNAEDEEDDDFTKL